MRKIGMMGFLALLMAVGPALLAYAQAEEGEGGQPPRGPRRAEGRDQGGRRPGLQIPEEKREAVEKAIKGFMPALKAFHTKLVEIVGKENADRVMRMAIGRFMQENRPPRPEGEGPEGRRGRPPRGEGQRPPRGGEGRGGARPRGGGGAG